MAKTNEVNPTPTLTPVNISSKNKIKFCPFPKMNQVVFLCVTVTVVVPLSMNVTPMKTHWS